MFESLRKFIFILLLLTLFITAIGYAFFLFIIPRYYFPYFPAIPVFLLLVTLLVHYYLVRTSEQDPRKFTARYLGAMGLKMFIYLAFLMVFLFLDTAHAVPFLVSFLVTYATFTLYEVIAILNFLKMDK